VPRLFRRRQVWMPTVWGVLLLAALIAAAVAALAPALGTFLAPREPAVGKDGSGAGTLVVEGWLDEGSLAQAAAFAVARQRYRRVLVSGGPLEGWREGQVWSTSAERAADYLRRHGIGAIPVVAVPAPAAATERSFLSAVVVRDWLQHEGLAVDAIDVFSGGVHARRSRLVYRLAFGPGVEVGIVAAAPSSYRLDRWWTTSEGVKRVLDELVGLAWTHCCVRPAPPPSHDERRPGPTAPS
jgi:hypothetical protein